MKLKIFKIYQDVNIGYDTFDSAIVCAKNEKEAREINPSGWYKFYDKSWWKQYDDGMKKEEKDETWVHPLEVKAIYLGEADDSVEEGVILASFNAG